MEENIKRQDATERCISATMHFLFNVPVRYILCLSIANDYRLGGIIMENNLKSQKHMSLGEKIKDARKLSGLTQEQLANKLAVSRQAITKWESDKGIPDIENIKILAKALNVSIDYLLDNGTDLDMNVFREEINLNDYNYKIRLSGRWRKKTAKKDMAVKQKFQNAEIYMLFGEQINTKSEKIIDNAIGFLTDAPFGIPQIINGFKNIDKEFYLVNQEDKQFFVVVTDEFIESRQLAHKITDKNFEIGQFRFVNCGILK